MGTRLYVGNLPFSADDEQVRELFSQNGRNVVEVKLVMDRDTGDADTILARIAEYVDAGVSKFILRPLGGDDDTLLAQTRQLIEQVLPRAEARWPKHPKTSDL